jgi:hypothetical protein
MSQVGNNQDRFGGQYMVQDRNHLSEISPATDKAPRGVRQSDQSQDATRQQGGDQGANTQQGGRRQRH